MILEHSRLPDGDPLVATVILNWNGREDTLECLSSLQAVDYPRHMIIVVDNGSTDGAADAIADQFPEVVVIINARNLGFAEGCNVGIRRALDENASFVYLLNNDTRVDPHFLRPLLNCFESDRRIGIVCSVNYLYDQPDTPWFGAPPTGMHRLIRTMLHKEDTLRLIPDFSSQKEYHELIYVPGSSIMLSRALIEHIGLFDDRFFAVYEDTDLCFRAIQNGYRIYLLTTSKVWHKTHRSFKNERQRQYYICRNCLLFFSKHATRRQWFVFLLYFWRHYLLSAIVRLICSPSKETLDRLLAYIEGTRDFMLKRFGQQAS